MVRRGAIYAKIQLQNEKHLHVFTTHMCSTHTPSLDDDVQTVILSNTRSLEHRQQQVDELAEFIADMLEDQYDHELDLAIVTGDFNILRYGFGQLWKEKVLKAFPTFEEILS